MDEIVITDDDIIELVAAEPEVELIGLDGADQEIVFVGDAGIQGTPGKGVAAGGTTGDVLTKLSEDDYATAWTPLNLIGDKTFTQAFTSASAVVVTHNLGKRPAVTVLDSANDEVEGEVEHLSTNQLVVSFSAPFSGMVVCN